jgi:tetratricopeptide (TPR) repeat protein
VRKKEASFWSDIKTLDERLTKDPDSYCFARLSEVYLKVGLITDALHTARKGAARHPGYLAGQRALAMACHASGLHDECRSTLEQVTAVMPEDGDALKMLAHLYAEKGDDEAAIRAYRTLLEFRPDDLDSKKQLEALLLGGENVSRDYVDDDLDVTDFTSPLDSGDDDEELESQDEEEIHDLEESDIFYDEVVDEEPAAAAPEVEKPVTAHHDPLSTVTLAELYVQQGFHAKALDIYRAILAEDPSNDQIRAKISELEDNDVELESDQDLTYVSDEFEAEPEQSFSAESNETPVVPEPSVFEPLPETPLQAEFYEEPDLLAAAMFDAVESAAEPVDFTPLHDQSADNAVNTLDTWLENIRRIKACR